MRSPAAGALFLLVGEPGIGKSRLAEELVAHARARGARVLVGRCWEAGGAPAYWPWVQSLRAYVRDSDAAALRSQLGAGAADLAQIVPELRERFPDLPEPPALESEGARFRLFDATVEFLRERRREPADRARARRSPCRRRAVAAAPAVPRPRTRLDAACCCSPPTGTSTRSPDGR